MRAEGEFGEFGIGTVEGGSRGAKGRDVEEGLSCYCDLGRRRRGYNGRIIRKGQFRLVKPMDVAGGHDVLSAIPMPQKDGCAWMIESRQTQADDR